MNSTNINQKMKLMKLIWHRKIKSAKQLGSKSLLPIRILIIHIIKSSISPTVHGMETHSPLLQTRNCQKQFQGSLPVKVSCQQVNQRPIMKLQSNSMTRRMRSRIWSIIL
ncbi:hypothetical protein FGO68_gene11853 [Halteria grandinella]|uniref:Uncharacterized protein n=1 Tax=Halteria grandinella TaxID=5974 RepID=A0A8J8SVG7_HALGN|nr:hypothetical protein FGO68_gene11853 [Halteria grandinella]